MSRKCFMYNIMYVQKMFYSCHEAENALDLSFSWSHTITKMGTSNRPISDSNIPPTHYRIMH